MGRARNPGCVAITGVKLVWTDNLEGTIGSGEMFNYTFKMVGAHTVTLTAMGSYTATVQFTIK